MPVITADIMSGMVPVIMAMIIPRIALMIIAAKIGQDHQDRPGMG